MKKYIVAFICVFVFISGSFAETVWVNRGILSPLTGDYEVVDTGILKGVDYVAGFPNTGWGGGTPDRTIIHLEGGSTYPIEGFRSVKVGSCVDILKKVKGMKDFYLMQVTGGI